MVILLSFINKEHSMYICKNKLKNIGILIFLPFDIAQQIHPLKNIKFIDSK